MLVSTDHSPGRGGRANPRSRSNTGRSYTQLYEEEQAPPLPESRPAIKSSRTPTNERIAQIVTSDQGNRPHFNRSTTYDPYSQPRRDVSPVPSRSLTRVPSDSTMAKTAISNLRHVERSRERDVFADDSASYSNSWSDQSHREPSTSPATSADSGNGTPLAKRAPPPPPPPSRAKKPPPPPVPQKRTIYA